MGPGSGSDNASASTAAHSVRDSLRHKSIETSAADRRHTPVISPPTRTAPGHTRVVHSAARRLGSGTKISRSAPHSKEYASPLGSSLAGATGPGWDRNPFSSSERIQASPTGVRTGVSEPASPWNATLASALPIPAQPANIAGIVGPQT